MFHHNEATTWERSQENHIDIGSGIAERSAYLSYLLCPKNKILSFEPIFLVTCTALQSISHWNPDPGKHLTLRAPAEVRADYSKVRSKTTSRGQKHTFSKSILAKYRPEAYPTTWCAVSQKGIFRFQFQFLLTSHPGAVGPLHGIISAQDAGTANTKAWVYRDLLVQPQYSARASGKPCAFRTRSGLSPSCRLNGSADSELINHLDALR